MKKILFVTFAILGWALLIVYLATGYFYNRFSEESSSILTPVKWDNHMAVFDGAISCSLTSQELQERRKELKDVIFDKLNQKKEHPNGFTYYFQEDDELLNQVMELIQKERACCPFFKFDLSILPFEKGFALKISGGEAVKEFLEDFESTVK